MKRHTDELIELASFFNKKLAYLYELATEIDDKWRIRLESKRKAAIKQTSTE